MSNNQDNATANLIANAIDAAEDIRDLGRFAGENRS
jgi:hypothetical protein